MKLHLVDATYELFRAFYGAPPASGAGGKEVGAVAGLLRSLLSLVRPGEATHVACAFDQTVESFRNQIFAGYKDGSGTDPQLLAQFELAERAARAAGFVVWPMREFEADDALASAAARWGDDPRLEQVIICSPDKDLAQCVRGNRVVCFNRRTRQMLDSEGVRKKYGVPPKSIADWLALVGDAADGIPGIRGWGRQSASRLLARYDCLERIPDYALEWEVPVRGARRLAASLRQNRKDAYLFRQLATLRTDVPLREDLSALRWQGVDERAFPPLCQELGQPRLQERVPKQKL